MGNATGLTAARMQQIIDSAIASGAVDLNGHLQLTRNDGSSVDAGLVRGATGAAGVGVVPGAMFAYGGSSIPAGYLACNGASVLRTAYPDLFAAIGTTYGAADATHFYVPDNGGWRGRSQSQATIPSAVFTTIGGFVTDTGYLTKQDRYYTYANGVFTIVTPGLYNLFQEVTYTTNGQGGRYIVAFYVNGVERARNDLKLGTFSFPIVLALTKAHYLNTGDTLEIKTYQNTGGVTQDLAATPGHILEMNPLDIGDIIKF